METANIYKKYIQHFAKTVGNHLSQILLFLRKSSSENYSKRPKRYSDVLLIYLILLSLLLKLKIMCIIQQLLSTATAPWIHR